MYNSNSGVRTYYKYNTIQGLDLDLTTLNFALTPVEKLAMICSGTAASLEYFAQKTSPILPETTELTDRFFYFNKESDSPHRLLSMLKD